MAAFADSDTVVLDACDAAGSEPLYIADIGHFNSSLDAVLKNLESYRPGRHGSWNVCLYRKGIRARGIRAEITCKRYLRGEKWQTEVFLK